MNAQEIRRHSGLGITSFAISLITIAVGFGVVLIASTHVGQRITINMNSPTAFKLTMATMLIPALAALGLGLGIAGMVQKSRRRLFASIGFVINAIFIIGVIVLFVFSATRLH